MKVTTQLYGQFLVTTPVNFTGTYFADTAGQFSHDQVSRFLRDSKLSPKIVRDKALSEIPFSPHGFILFDDTVIDKNSSFTNRTDYIVTNDLSQNSADGVRNASAIRWKIEEFHRELKQITGIEKCQSRSSRAQRNHISLCIPMHFADFCILWNTQHQYSKQITFSYFEIVNT